MSHFTIIKVLRFRWTRWCGLGSIRNLVNWNWAMIIKLSTYFIKSLEITNLSSLTHYTPQDLLPAHALKRLTHASRSII